MGAHNDLYPIALFKEHFESIDIRAGGITDNQTGGQMDNLGPVFHHFIAGVFYVAPRDSPSQVV